MIRQELHKSSRQPEALSHTLQRPHFDTIAWKQARARREAQAADAVAALLARLEEAAPARARHTAAAQAA